MSELQKRAPDGNANVPAKVQGPGTLSSQAAFAELSVEERKALALKHFEQQLVLGASAQAAEQKNVNCDRALGNFVDNITDLEHKTSSDISGEVEAENAGGITRIKYTKNNNTVIIVIAIVVAVLAFLILSR